VLQTVSCCMCWSHTYTLCWSWLSATASWPHYHGISSAHSTQQRAVLMQLASSNYTQSQSSGMGQGLTAAYMSGGP
jgi:hypothetical protein